MDRNEKQNSYRNIQKRRGKGNQGKSWKIAFIAALSVAVVLLIALIALFAMGKVNLGGKKNKSTEAKEAVTSETTAGQETETTEAVTGEATTTEQETETTEAVTGEATTTEQETETTEAVTGEATTTEADGVTERLAKTKETIDELIKDTPGVYYYLISAEMDAEPKTNINNETARIPEGSESLRTLFALGTMYEKLAEGLAEGEYSNDQLRELAERMMGRSPATNLTADVSDPVEDEILLVLGGKETIKDEDGKVTNQHGGDRDDGIAAISEFCGNVVDDLASLNYGSGEVNLEDCAQFLKKLVNDELFTDVTNKEEREENIKEILQKAADDATKQPSAVTALRGKGIEPLWVGEKNDESGQKVVLYVGSQATGAETETEAAAESESQAETEVQTEKEAQTGEYILVLTSTPDVLEDLLEKISLEVYDCMMGSPESDNSESADAGTTASAEDTTNTNGDQNGNQADSGYTISGGDGVSGDGEAATDQGENASGTGETPASGSEAGAEVIEVTTTESETFNSDTGGGTTSS